MVICAWFCAFMGVWLMSKLLLGEKNKFVMLVLAGVYVLHAVCGQDV